MPPFDELSSPLATKTQWDSPLLLGLLTICVKNDALLIPHDEMCNEERDES